MTAIEHIPTPEERLALCQILRDLRPGRYGFRPDELRGAESLQSRGLLIRKETPKYGVEWQHPEYETYAEHTAWWDWIESHADEKEERPDTWDGFWQVDDKVWVRSVGGKYLVRFRTTHSRAGSVSQWSGDVDYGSNWVEGTIEHLSELFDQVQGFLETEHAEIEFMIGDREMTRSQAEFAWAASGKMYEGLCDDIACALKSARRALKLEDS